MKKKYFFTISSQTYIYIYALFTLGIFNLTFFEKLYAVNNSISWVLGGGIVVYAALCLILNILFFNNALAKGLGIALLLLNSIAFYFMSAYNILIDKIMILNVIRTNIYEAGDLFQWKLPLFFCLSGLLPSYIVYKTRISFLPWRLEFFRRLKHSGMVLLPACFCIMSAPKAAQNALQNHYELRYAQVPSNYIGAIIGVAKMHEELTRPFTPVATDAKVTKYWNNDKKNLFVFVVGETARAENFSLGGYKRPTNQALTPQLDNIVYYPRFYACGTSTAVAVPCMFSKDGRKNFVPGSELNTGNLADVMNDNGYHALWRENNTGCQDNCNRIEVEELCNRPSCQDDILLENLPQKISDINQNTFLILHQRGSHGPDYFNRYPDDWKAPYMPVCTDAGLKSCSYETLINAYDNTIAYTSIFLNKLINQLKNFENEYNIVMIYASDHGESLGEKGMYLHAYPYDTAPENQKHIPALIWMPDSSASAFGIDIKCLQKEAKKYHSHDNLFHSFLGLAGISTKDYKPELDIFRSCRK